MAIEAHFGLLVLARTTVGYGLQRVRSNPAGPDFTLEDLRREIAVLNLVSVRGTAGVPRGTSVLLSGNAHTGGTCFGDSGRPLFLNDTNIVAAVTSFGINGNCAGVGGGYRVDTQDDLDRVATFLGTNDAVSQFRQTIKGVMRSHHPSFGSLFAIQHGATVLLLDLAPTTGRKSNGRPDPSRRSRPDPATIAHLHSHGRRGRIGLQTIEPSSSFWNRPFMGSGSAVTIES